MWTRNFWRQSAERAVKTAAQAAILALGADAANVLHSNGWVVLAAAGSGALLSVLTSIVTSGIGEPGDPSAVKQTV